MNSNIKVLFVCMGNICRSPAGENLMRAQVKEAGLAERILCDSAGTIGYHSGERPDARMSSAASARGYQFTGRARQVRFEDFDEFDYVLAMDDDNYSYLDSLAGDSERRQKLRRFAEFCADDVDYVPDPYYGGRRGFENVLDLVEEGCENLLAEIRREHGF